MHKFSVYAEGHFVADWAYDGCKLSLEFITGWVVRVESFVD